MPITYDIETDDSTLIKTVDRAEIEEELRNRLSELQKMLEAIEKAKSVRQKSLHLEFSV